MARHLGGRRARATAAVAFLFGIGGCMASPRDGQTVRAGETIHYEGYTLTPSATVDIQYKRVDTGQWVPWSRTASASTPTRDSVGRNWYAWTRDTASAGVGGPYWRWRPGGWDLVAETRAVSISSSGTLEPIYAFRTDADACVEATAPLGGLEVVARCSSGMAAALVMENQVRGDAGCPYGSAECNACVANVEATFAAIPTAPNGRFRFFAREGEWLPPGGDVLTELNWTDHIQGFARIPGVQSQRGALDNWFVATRSHPGGDDGSFRGGFFLAQMDDLSPRGGEALDSAVLSDPARSTDFFHRVYGTDHAGGLQMIGQTLAFSAECSEDPNCFGQSFVEFWDLRDPGRAQRILRYQLDGSRGEPRQYRPGAGRGYASGVAVTRLANGRFLMFVLDKDTSGKGWFYASNGTSLRSAQWQYRGAFDRQTDLLPGPTSWHTYQNVAFVNECGTGRIYLVATGNDDYYDDPFDYSYDTPEKVHLFRVEDRRLPGGRLTLTRVAEKIVSPGTGDYCSTRAGASVHATASGDLALYCAAHHSADGDVKFAEYAR